MSMLVISEEEGRIFQKELEKKTKEWWDKFNLKFGKLYSYPVLRFNLRGVVAGYAHYRRHEIQYNLGLYKLNKDDFNSDTVPHEIAHLFNYKLNIELNNFYYYKRPKPHGKEWKRIMLTMGLDAIRCHNYEVENVRIVKKPYIYKCSCREHHLSNCVHMKIKRGQRRWCLKCKVDLVYVREIEEEGSSSISLTSDEIKSMDYNQVITRIKELQEKMALLS